MESLPMSQVIALMLLVAVLVYGLTHHWFGKRVDAAVAEVKAKAQSEVKAIENYTDAEVAKLAGSLVARLADTSAEQQAKTDADAAIARKGALLARVQSVVASAKQGA